MYNVHDQSSVGDARPGFLGQVALAFPPNPCRGWPGGLICGKRPWCQDACQDCTKVFHLVFLAGFGYCILRRYVYCGLLEINCYIVHTALPTITYLDAMSPRPRARVGRHEMCLMVCVPVHVRQSCRYIRSKSKENHPGSTYVHR